MKSLTFLSVVAVTALLATQSAAGVCGNCGVGGFEPGSTRDPNTGVVTAPDDTSVETTRTRGNNKGRGNGRGNGRQK